MRRVCAVHGPQVTHSSIGPLRRFIVAGGLVLLGGDLVAIGGRLVPLGCGLVTVRGRLVGVGSALFPVGDHLIRGKQHQALDATLPLSEGTVSRIRIIGLVVCVLHPLASGRTLAKDPPKCHRSELFWANRLLARRPAVR